MIIKIFTYSSVFALFTYFGLNLHTKTDFASTPATQTTVVCDPNLTGVAKLVCLADEFKATLTSTQIATLELPYTLANAKKWSNLPVTFVARIGIRLGDLNATQLAAAKALIQAASGTQTAEGYDEIQGLWAADDYLLANGGGTAYGAGQYYLAFLGTPSTTGTWILQTGGHHVAVTNSYSNGQMMGATPSFRAAEPFAAFISGGTTYQPIVQERDAFAAMLGGLTTTELASAKLTATFSDILLGPNKDWQFPATKIGLRANTLATAQKNLILNAIKTYVQDVDDASAATIMATYTAEIDDTYIAYSGNASMTVRNDYVRIDGPHVWIEYSTQNGIVLSPTHPHSVWRDHTGDYGGLGNTTVTADLKSFKGAVKAMPNPVQSTTNLSVSLPNDADITLFISDNLGRNIQTLTHNNLSTGEQQLPVDLSRAAAGVYQCLVAVKTASGTTFAVQKIVKL